MASRRSPQKESGPKSGATNPSAPAPTHSGKFSQMEKQIAEIRNGTIRDGLEEFRRLSYEIEAIDRRLDERIRRTGETLDDLKVQVYRHEAEMVELRRQVKFGSASSSPLNQQAGNDRFSIAIYSEERITLSRSLNFFYTWALSHKSEDALNYSRPVVMTTMKSRTKLEIEYGERNVEQPLVVWNALTKAAEKGKTIADIAVEAKAPSEARKILTNMVEDDSSERVKKQA